MTLNGELPDWEKLEQPQDMQAFVREMVATYVRVLPGFAAEVERMKEFGEYDEYLRQMERVWRWWFEEYRDQKK